MELVELSDLIGAIEAYIAPMGLGIADLKTILRHYYTGS
jgi:hypothetical protein